MQEFIKSKDKIYQYTAKHSGATSVMGGDADYFVPEVVSSFDFGQGIEEYFTIGDHKDQFDTTGKTEKLKDGKLSVSVGDSESIFQITETGIKIERVFHTRPTEPVRYKIKKSKDVVLDYQPTFEIRYGTNLANWIDSGLSVDDFPLGTLEYFLVNSTAAPKSIGSYVIRTKKQGRYKDKAGKTIVNYLQGKMGQIYAPDWVDAVGNIFRGTQEVIGDEIIYPLPPEEWLDSAVLPLSLDPDIGYTTVGSSTFNNSPGRLYAFKATTTPASNGTLDSLSFYVPNTAQTDCRLAIYDDDTAYPDALVYGGPEVTVGDGSIGWSTHTVSGTYNIVSGTQYWNTIWPSANMLMSYDAAPAASYYRAVKTYSPTDPWDDPFPVGAAAFSFLYSMYFTYTASGGPTGNPWYYYAQQAA